MKSQYKYNIIKTVGLFTAIITIGTIQTIFACGGGDFEEDYFYYNLINQKNISADEYHPFLRTEMSRFYISEESYYYDENDDANNDEDDGYYKGNILLWKNILKDRSIEEVNEIVYKGNGANWPNNKLEEQADQYLELARDCNETFAYREDYSWEYSDILKNDEIDITGLLEYGNELYIAETNQQLKQRYAYQIVRILHYARRYEDAIVFFNENVLSNNKEQKQTEIFYYTMDQVAGCYYSLEQYEQAAYYFLKVFNNSKDRKKSAFVSYSFCTNKNAEGKTLFQGDEDEQMHIFMRSLRSFSDALADLKLINEKEPASPKVELLFMREMNLLERVLLPRHLGVLEETLPKTDLKYQQRAADLLDFAKKISSQNNNEFWKISESFLHFLLKDIPKAKEILAELETTNSNHFEEQRNRLKEIYTIFEWDKMDAQKEEYLHQLFDTLSLNDAQIRWKNGRVNQDIVSPMILDHVGHIYLQNGSLAKSFLVHNRLHHLDLLSYFPLIDDLLDFVKKENKNEWEQKLWHPDSGKNISEYQENTNRQYKYLLNTKGLYYLREGRTLQALEQFNNANTIDLGNNTDNAFGHSITADIFSNNTIECFNCYQDTIMVDSVYMASIFKFIPAVFKQTELPQILLKLDSLTNHETQWKRKLGHYLLGNYYFNVSNTGYFRDALNNKYGNCCDYYYDTWNSENEPLFIKRIKTKTAYNLYNMYNHDKMYYGLANKAYPHYEQVLANSIDKELNARTLYLMAKCELNDYYNNQEDKSLTHPRYGYIGGKNANTEDYQKSFKRLKEEYANTRFSKMILKECSFFRYYCSL